jgi:TonB family protein
MNDNSKKEEKTKTGDDSLLSVINKIGSLDLTGEKAARKQEETDKIRSELVAQGKLSAAEIKELDRRKALEENPYRRPGAIKSIIDENASQLKYLYNKRLRQGIKLSGKMVVEIAIKPNGSIRSAKIARSNMGDKGFEEEIVSQVLKWKFKSVIDSLGDMTVNYPMEFSEEE